MTNKPKNLDLWNRHADIDPKFTKPITGKPYRGTSPSPQHVIWCLTEMFGPVGEGFGWDVVAEGFQPLLDETLHWCRIRFWHTSRAYCWDAYGQTKAVAKTRNGLVADEDAPKKSLTDAIIKAASQLGVAGNIFLGRWDDQKYVAEVAEQFHGAAEKPKAEPPKADHAKMRDRLVAAVKGQITRFGADKLWAQESFNAAFRALPEPMQLEVKAVREKHYETLPPDDDLPQFGDDE